MEKIEKLKKIFKREKIDGYIVPKNDEFFGEYVPEYNDRLNFISSFNGSYGFALVLKDKNYLFVDGRYTIQAKKQSGTYFKIIEILKFLPHQILKNLNLGYDPKLFTKSLLILVFSSASISETKLIILGSGTPNPDPERYGSGYAVVVNESAYIVDFGPGIVRRISAMSPTWGGDFPSMELQNINTAFLTHIHSDHSGALTDLILTPWIMGRDAPLKLYGPSGLEAMSKNITEAYIDDINYRLYGSQPANELGFKTNVTEIVDDGSIYKDKNVEVIAFKNNHGDFKNSFGFLFITDDKRILFSGDTAVSANLKKYVFVF